LVGIVSTWSVGLMAGVVRVYSAAKKKVAHCDDTGRSHPH
jgi:hypothetical protein